MNFGLQLVNEVYYNFYSHAENNNIISKEYQRNAVFILIYQFCMHWLVLKKSSNAWLR